uniref:Uncharacterized protein n=1 Tax=Solanum tuberosum TaxID=4113 RepID=M1DX58_SOLTU
MAHWFRASRWGGISAARVGPLWRVRRDLRSPRTTETNPEREGSSFLGFKLVSRLPRSGITNLDRLPRSSIIMGSVATFRHNHWIGYHVPWDSPRDPTSTLWLCTDTAIALIFVEYKESSGGY